MQLLTTSDLIAALRADIKRELREEILAELQPEIERRLYGNIFDIKEAARYLKQSESTLRRRIKDQDIPHFYQRGCVYFRQIDLDRDIERRLIRSKDGAAS